MRYTCPDCGRWVKDKFFWGTLHICLSPEERQALQLERERRAYFLRYPGGGQAAHNAVNDIMALAARLGQPTAEQRAALLAQEKAMDRHHVP